MTFIDPKTDFAFKKIFGSHNHEDILISLLNAVLEGVLPAPIEKVEIMNPYQAPKIRGMKDTFLDIKAIDQNQNNFVIEMQVLNVEGFEKRVLYNACKGYAGQISKGQEYVDLAPVIAVTFTDFVMFEDLPSVDNIFRLRADQVNQIYSDDLVLMFIELTKFTKGEHQLESTLDKWLFFLKYAADLKQAPDVLRKEPAINNAFNVANRASLTRNELDEQERREMFIQDQRGAISLASKKSLAKGREEGRKEGLEAAKIAIARNLLAVMDDQQISATTGLSCEQVHELRNESQ